MCNLADYAAAVAAIGPFADEPWLTLSLLIPAAELVIGFRLVEWRADPEALAVGTLMFGVFLVYQIVVVAQIGAFASPTGACPCFAYKTGEPPAVQIVYVLRALFFFGSGAFCLFTAWRGTKPEATPELAVPAGATDAL